MSTGIEQGEVTEIMKGLQEGERVITTGAAALAEGDRIVLGGQGQGGEAGLSLHTPLESENRDHGADGVHPRMGRQVCHPHPAQRGDRVNARSSPTRSHHP